MFKNKINDFINGIKNHNNEKKLKKNIRNYYRKTTDSEIRDLLKYMDNHKLNYFNYDFIEKYNGDIDIFYDEKQQLRYVIYENKRMYMKKSWNNERIKAYCNFLFAEQDKNSPHCYLDDNSKNLKYKKVIDAGGAEGIFSLQLIDIAEKIYIFECDDEWLEALHATFDPWKEKVEIVNKYVTSKDSKSECTLDSFFENDNLEIDILKLDIEGEEINALRGSKMIVNENPQLTIYACVYHYAEEEKDIRQLFENYKIVPQKGYILFIQDENIAEPFFRRCVLKISKKINN